MKVYDIVTPYNYGQTHSVVAENMGEAERLYKQKYSTVRIVEIKLHADYVLLAAQQEDSDERNQPDRFIVPAPSHESPTISSPAMGDKTDHAIGGKA